MVSKDFGEFLQRVTISFKFRPSKDLGRATPRIDPRHLTADGLSAGLNELAVVAVRGALRGYNVSTTSV